MEYVIPALQALLTPAAILAMIVGTAVGIVLGALPGIGSVVAITMVLPFTYTMGQVPAVAMVLAVYCASVYGGSISAILINTPGTPQSAATTLDGYPMVLRGEGDYAIGWATVSSVIGGLFSIVVLVLAAPQLAAVALRFGAVETFALICLALTCIAWVSRGSMIKGLFAGVFGLFLATVGIDSMTGQTRFDFDIFALTGGIELIPVLVGIFALSEVFMRASGFGTDAETLTTRVGFKVAPFSEWKKRYKTLLKSCVIGSLVGVLPGTGAATASFIAYSEAKRSGRYRDKLGTGEPEGIIASESSNNAVTGGALVPTLALGIPGDAVTAVVMSTLIIQGIQPGVRLFVDNPGIVYAAFMSLVFINLIMLAMAAAGAPLFMRILKMPQSFLLTMIVILSVLGAYGVRGNSFDLVVLFIAGLVGFAMRYSGVPVAPVVIGMVLGPILEESLRQGLILKRGSFLAFYTGHPIALALLIVTIFILVVPIVQTIKDFRRKGLEAVVDNN
ncbi:MAG: tripartite tricarboxylate transporter permease [Aquisalimonadaceae bacterium]